VAISLEAICTSGMSEAGRCPGTGTTTASVIVGQIEPMV
jgi:hypothetical protein